MIVSLKLTKFITIKKLIIDKNPSLLADLTLLLNPSIEHLVMKKYVKIINFHQLQITSLKEITFDFSDYSFPLFNLSLFTKNILEKFKNLCKIS